MVKNLALSSTPRVGRGQVQITMNDVLIDLKAPGEQ